jgi:hypothetical protein
MIEFGKFKGKTIEEVIEIEPSYIVWLHGKNLIEIDDETLRKARRRQREDYLERLAFSCRHEDAGDRD